MLVAFFGVVIGVNVTMMKLAIATLPGTEVDSPYAAGLAYDREISAAQDQAARKWKVNAHIERARRWRRRASGRGARRAAASRSTGLKFGGRLERPTDKRADLAVELVGGRHRHLSRHAAAVAPGQWDLVHRRRWRGERACSCRSNRVILN